MSNQTILNKYRTEVDALENKIYRTAESEFQKESFQVHQDELDRIDSKYIKMAQISDERHKLYELQALIYYYMGEDSLARRLVDHAIKARGEPYARAEEIRSLLTPEDSSLVKSASVIRKGKKGRRRDVRWPVISVTGAVIIIFGSVLSGMGSSVLQLSGFVLSLVALILAARQGLSVGRSKPGLLSRIGALMAALLIFGVASTIGNGITQGRMLSTSTGQASLQVSLRNVAEAKRRTLPSKVSDAITWVDASATQKSLVLSLVVGKAVDESSVDMIAGKREVTSRLCNDLDARYIMGLGGTYIYNYKFESSGQTKTFSVDIEGCNSLVPTQ